MKLTKIFAFSFLAVAGSSSVVFAAEPVAEQKGAEAVTAVKAEKVPALLKADPKIVIIDIRTPEEFESGHLANAKNINFSADTFKAELDKLDKDKTYLMHCRSGGRSTASLPVWKELGFKKVLHLDSGILGVEKAGIGLVKGKK